MSDPRGGGKKGLSFYFLKKEGFKRKGRKDGEFWMGGN